MDYLRDERKVIYDPNIKLYTAKTVIITKIVMYNEHLRIDFTQYACREFVNGGWTCINKSIFVRPQGTTLKVPLVGAYHIPLSPKKHYFASKDDHLYFTLMFPAISRDTKFIDIIEKENGDSTNFNFYGVALQQEEGILKRIQYSLTLN